jgi:hypothetical protein
LTLVFLTLLLPSLEAEEELRVLVQAGPGPVKVREPWVISLLIDHGKPEELKVEFPPLTGYLILDRMSTAPRVMEGPETATWTQVECIFIPQRAGRAELEYIKVSVPGGEFTTGVLGVDVTGDTAVPGSYHPRLSWRTPLPPFTAGEKSELTLLLSGWDPQKPLVFPLPFRIDLSPSLILESRSPGPSEQRAGAVLILICIPLEAGAFSLPSLSLDYRGESLRAPPLRLNAAPRQSRPPGAAPALPAERSRAGDTAGDGAQERDRAQRFAFPSLRPPLLPFFRASYHATAEKARTHWEAGDYGQALAALRQGERDLGSGPALASLRSEAEKALGLEFTYDEQWLPRLPLRIAAILVFFALAVLCLSGMAGGVKDRGKKGSKRPYVLAALLFVVLFLGIGGIALTGAEPPRSRNRVILRGGPAYRTPDYSGSVSAEFREGQPALIRSRIPLWIYAETYDGLSGWLPPDRAISY